MNAVQDACEREKPGHRAYLGLGSSLGDRIKNLRDAVHRLNSPEKGTIVLAVSPIYETPHMGLLPEDAARYPAHLNCVALIITQLLPEILLTRIRGIEAEGQRKREERWGPRTIDIDILLYDSVKQQTGELNLPHSGIASRIFVLKPLSDLAPDLVLPDGQAIRDLLASEAIRAQPIKRVETDELLI